MVYRWSKWSTVNDTGTDDVHELLSVHDGGDPDDVDGLDDLNDVDYLPDLSVDDVSVRNVQAFDSTRGPSCLHGSPEHTHYYSVHTHLLYHCNK